MGVVSAKHDGSNEPDTSHLRPILNGVMLLRTEGVIKDSIVSKGPMTSYGITRVIASVP